MTALMQYNQIYKAAGAVHGCALCSREQVEIFVEDVGRHNAVDTIAGKMWLERIRGNDKILYSTGRLTSEIVMKAALMEIPVLLSRSGITHMGLELAQELGITMIARIKGSKFLIFNGQKHFIHDM
jgi:FdhD protein